MKIGIKSSFWGLLLLGLLGLCGTAHANLRRIQVSTDTTSIDYNFQKIKNTLKDALMGSGTNYAHGILRTSSIIPITNAVSFLGSLTYMWKGLFVKFLFVDGSIIYPEAYGAEGDGVTDDTAAIQAAIDAANSRKGAVHFKEATYKISDTLNLYQYSRLIGHPGMSGDTGGTIISQSNGAENIFNLLTDGNSGSQEQYIYIFGLHLLGGVDQIYAPNGGVMVYIQHVLFNGPSHAGIYARGFVQEWFGRDWVFRGGQYGMLHNGERGLAANGVTLATQVLFDKSNFYSVYATGQTKNGLRIDCGGGTGNGNTFTDLRVFGTGEDGLVLAGGLRNTVIVNFTTESNGYLGVSPSTPTTATTVANSSYVVVGSTAGYTAGSTVTIQGAGSSDLRTDWYPVISQVFTSSMVMTSVATATVTSLEMVPYLYSDLICRTSGGAIPNGITVLNPTAGILSAVGAVRYPLDFRNAFGVTVVGLVSSRRMYDPNGVSILIGASGEAQRTAFTTGATEPGAQVDIRAAANAYPGFSPFRIMDDDGTVNYEISANGNIASREEQLEVQPGNGRVGIRGTQSAALSVTGKNTTDNTLQLNAMAAQSSELLKAVDTGGNSLFKIDIEGMATVDQSTEAFKFGERSLDITSAPSSPGILAVNSSNELYISTGMGAGAWVKVGSQ